MHGFEYLAPVTLPEVVRAAASRPGAVSLLAGGTDLIVGMRAGRRRPTLVVDVKKIPELTGIVCAGTEVVVGAAVPCRTVYEHPVIASRFTALAEAARRVGGIQIQGRASLGGNLCNAAPSADVVPSLMAYGALGTIASPSGLRTLAVSDFCVGPGRTRLADGEVLVNLTLPLPTTRSGAMFLRFTPRNEMDIAVVNVAACVELDEALQSLRAIRVAIGAVAPVPLLVDEVTASLTGRPANDATLREAAAICERVARPISDLRGTIEHRRQLVTVLVRRALEGALQRARGART
jgi:carbon-monoxide dehydrogenase medium subunit